MKLAQHENTLETNAEVKSKDFRIGNASIIIEIMRKHMYQHPIRTLVQEYMSNARDATREAKTKDRLVVSVPNHMSPVFKVRDFGPGITPERMDNIFIAYGSSTKRNANTQTGGFGIGAKSAWSYGDSFTIVSITGGVKRTYVAHTGVNNNGRLDLLSEVNTDEATGAEIQVAVKPQDIENFKEAVWRACYFWKDEEYPEFKGITKDEVPKRKAAPISLKSDNGTKFELIANNDLPYWLRLETSYHGKHASLIIDGIPYIIGDKITEGASDLMKLLGQCKQHAVFYVGNGVVEIAASREVITDSDQTKANLNAVAKGAFEVLGEYLKDQFAKAKTNSEWMQKYSELRRIANVDTYSKRGDYFITDGSIESKAFRDFAIYTVGASQSRRNKGKFKRERIMSISMDDTSHMFYLDNLSEALVTQNRRIKEYLDKGASRIILLVPQEKTEMILAPMVNGKQTFDKEGNKLMVSKTLVTLANSTKAALKVSKDLNAKDLSTLTYTIPPRVPKEKKDRTNEMFTIHTVNEYGKHPDTTTISQVESRNAKYLYVKYQDYAKYESEFKDICNYTEFLNYRVCAMTEDSIDMVSGSKHFESYVAWKSNFKVTPKILTACCTKKAVNKKEMKELSLSTDKIKDKLIAQMVEQYKGFSENTEAVLVPETIIKLASKEIKDFLENDEALTKLLKANYPLIKAVSSIDDYRCPRNKERANELVCYINAKV